MGPVTLEALQEMVKQNGLRDLWVLREDFAHWQPADNVRELNSQIETPDPRRTKLITGVATFIVAAGFAALRQIGPFIDEQNGIQNSLTKVVEQVRPTLPEKLDGGTTLIDISHEGMSLTYYLKIDTRGYQLPNDFIGAIRGNIVREICDNETFKGMVRAGAALRYDYVDVTNKHLGAVVVSGRDCSLPTGVDLTAGH